MQGLPATAIAHLPERARRRRTQTLVDGAAFEEEDAVDGEEDEWMQGDQAKQEGQGMEEVFASLSSMKVEVEGLRNPQGSYHSPARTCKELWLLNPELPNGTFISLCLLDLSSYMSRLIFTFQLCVCSLVRHISTAAVFGVLVVDSSIILLFSGPSLPRSHSFSLSR